jgi:hypothetical protein
MSQQRKWGKIFLCLSLVIFTSCSTMPKKTTTPAASETLNVGGERPKWVEEPYSECMEKIQLCSVGEGNGGMLAEANGRRNIALVFKAGIKSSSTFSKMVSQGGNPAAAGLEGQVSETASSKVEEFTDGILNGVNTLKKYNDSKRGVVYALVSLDKGKAAKDLEQKIASIDESMQLLAKQKTPALRRMLALYKERSGLEERHAVVSERPLPSPITLEQIYGEKSKGSEKTAYIDWSGDWGLKDLQADMEEILQDNDFNIVREKKMAKNGDDAKGMFLRVVGSIKAESAHLKVEGFVKKIYSGEISLVAPSGENQMTMPFNLEETGRTEDQTLVSALAKLKEQLRVKFKNIVYP